LVKKILYHLTRILSIILVTAVLLIGVLHNHYVQSFIAKAGSSWLSSSLGVSVWVERVYISSYLNILLENVQINDHKGEILISAKNIQLDLPIFKPFVDEIPINEVRIDSAFINLVKYIDSEDLNITLLFANNDSNNPSTDSAFIKEPRNPIKIGLDQLLIENTRFVYQVEKHDTIESEEILGMDYIDLDIDDIEIEMKDIHLIDDSIIGDIIRLSAKEKCGVILSHLEGNAIVSSTSLILNKGKLFTPRSRAIIDLNFHYKDWASYLDYINMVDMEAYIHPSTLQMEDIAYFAPEMIGMDNVLRLKGRVSGPVRNLKAKELQISYGNTTSFRGNVQITGLPDIYESFSNVRIKDFSTSLEDVESFNLPGGAHIDQIPKEIGKLGKIRLKGRYTGFYNDFVTQTELYSEIGMLQTDIQFTNNSQEDIVYYRGDFDARNFNLGRFLDMENDFGDINFDLNIAGKGLDLASLETNITGRIDSLSYKNNEINTIFINALVEENLFEGSLQLQDNLINTDFSGSIQLDPLNPAFDFVARFKDVKLAQLGLLDIDSSASLSTRLHMNFTGAEVDSFIGFISLDSTKFLYQNVNYTMDSLYILSENMDLTSNKKHIKISSDFINGDLKGNYNLQYLANSAEEQMKNYISHLDFVADSLHNGVLEDFHFDFTISNTEILSELFIPEIGFDDTLFLSGGFSSPTQILSMDIHSRLMTINEVKLIQPRVGIEAKAKAAHVSFHTDEIILKERNIDDTLQLGLDQMNMDFNFQNDSMGFALDWNNMGSSLENKGDIKGAFHFLSPGKMDVELHHTEIILNDTLWQSKEQGSVSIDSNHFNFNHLLFFSKDQSLLLDGDISENKDDIFLLRFDNFNISVFNIITKKYGIKLDGFLTGDYRIIDAYHSFNFLADLDLNKLNLNGNDLGWAEINSTWNTDESVFVNINIQKEGNKGVYKPLYLEGFYSPQAEQNKQLDIDIDMNHLSIDFIYPFLKDYISDLEGVATGKIQVKGSIKEPDLSGSLELARTQFRIIYLNTLYSVAGPLTLDNHSLAFKEVYLYDTVGNRALLNGGLSHKRLKDFGVDLKVKPENFVALNTRKGMNELFYGKAVVTGDVSISGPFDNVFLDINATSKRGTSMSIPINTSQGVSENNFIVFMRNDSSLAKEEFVYQPKLANFSLNMDLSINPDAHVELSLPAQLGEIQAEGFGDLNMNMSRTGNFRMSGDYRVSRGVFYFRIRNLLNRRFDLNEGGSISWSGDPYNGTLGMSATYQVKTSLNSLGLEQDSSYRNRIPVDCKIGLSGPIMNPNVKFNFDFPNATEEVKQYVYTKIDTSNASEMSQQMLSLLVFNSFSFNNGTGANSLANNVSGSSMQIVANQVSNWLSQISKDVDVGINYRPGGDLTNEEVEVALSTQLFDERVTIDGNFGYQNVQDNPSANTSSIVGDINVEVKITPDGRLRLKAFNRTNTVDLLDNTSPYTQGVGIFYRKEFNNFKELFQNQRRKERKKQEELKKNQEKALRDEQEEPNKQKSSSQ